MIAFVGDGVWILDSGLHYEKDGEVVAASFGSVENDYVIALDKESHLADKLFTPFPTRKNSLS